MVLMTTVLSIVCECQLVLINWTKARTLLIAKILPCYHWNWKTRDEKNMASRERRRKRDRKRTTEKHSPSKLIHHWPLLHMARITPFQNYGQMISLCNLRYNHFLLISGQQCCSSGKIKLIKFCYVDVKLNNNNNNIIYKQINIQF